MTAGRVLFVTQTAHAWGGVEEWLELVSGALEEDEWDVTIGLVRGRRFHQPDRYLDAHRYRRTVEIDGRAGTREGRVAALVDTIRKLAPDVVVPVNIAETLEAVRRLRSRDGHPRVLYPMHGFLGSQYGDVHGWRDVVDFAAAPNRLAVRALVEVGGLEPRRVAYAQCGAVVPAPTKVRTAASQGLRIGWAGRLIEEQKRISDLASMLEKLSAMQVGFSCAIAGAGNGERQLRERLGPLVEAGTVQFLGLLEREELYARFYSSLDVLVVTSDWETGPIVAWEAMLFGVSVVSTRYLGASCEGALVEGETALLADVGDTTGLANALAACQADPGLRTRIGERGRALAVERYSHKASRDAWVAAFNRVMELPPTTEVRREAVVHLAGRLERAFGWRAAALLRKASGRIPQHSDTGGEWPHTMSEWPGGESAFRRLLADLEAGRSVGESGLR